MSGRGLRSAKMQTRATRSLALIGLSTLTAIGTRLPVSARPGSFTVDLAELSDALAELLLDRGGGVRVGGEGGHRRDGDGEQAGDGRAAGEDEVSHRTSLSDQPEACPLPRAPFSTKWGRCLAEGETDGVWKE